MKEIRKVLICPIDWGLGHATRCIPVIREFLSKGCEVQIASSGDALALLKREFNQLDFYEITGYHPFYAATRSLTGELARQIPKFVNVIRQEHREIEQIIKQEGIDLIISDNRFGCWSRLRPCVFISHQLNIKTPAGLSWAVNFINRRYIRKFTACWVPDAEGMRSLAGELVSNPGVPVTFVGWLSRFHNAVSTPKKYDLLAIVSGPEPQRTNFEKLMRVELRTSGKKALMVLGQPKAIEKNVDGRVEVISHLGAMELNHAILESDIIISRSGYSTIMDLAVLGKRAIFVPTPGQPEQEYLGRALMEKKIALCLPQHSFNLEAALNESRHYSGFAQHNSDDRLSLVIDNLLRTINQPAAN